MVENWKTVAGVLVVTVIIVVISAIGLSNTANKDKLSSDELEDGAGWVWGSDEAKVTVVVFSDLQCPACREGEKVAISLRQMDGVKFVFRHFPLMMIHKNARAAALVVEGAKRMGKGWEMMELLFERQSEWSEVEDFVKIASGYAGELGLDLGEFNQVMRMSDLEEQIVRDEGLAMKLRLSGTPTFFVNGKAVATNLVISEVSRLLDGG